MEKECGEDSGHLSAAGFTTENLKDSPSSEVGAGRGKILPADQIIVTTGLYLSGKEKQAKRAAKIFCDGLKKIPNYYYAGGFIGTWTAAAFQILANLYSNL